ncbi:MAG: hypothetical protein H7233_04660 [Pseudorhodobacter sp.]|nr:hypothetical protein [Frankiaceae bacterium]
MRAPVVLVVVAATLVLGASAATAAGVGTAPTQLSAGSAAVGSCGAFALTSSPYVVDPASGTVTAVRVTVASSCNGGQLSVSLRTGTAPATSTPAGQGGAAVSAAACPGNVCTVSITSPPGLDLVQAVHLVISGP